MHLYMVVWQAAGILGGYWCGSQRRALVTSEVSLSLVTRMASSNNSSSSSLCDMEALKARLQEKESTLLTAAQYGYDLLETNRELTQCLDDTNRKYTRQVEVDIHTHNNFLCLLCQNFIVIIDHTCHLEILFARLSSLANNEFVGGWHKRCTCSSNLFLNFSLVWSIILIRLQNIKCINL